MGELGEVVVTESTDRLKTLIKQSDCSIS